jgi:hypothetical protein
LKINNNKIPIEYSKPAKPNIYILVLKSVMSSFITPWNKTLQYKIIHVISEKNNNLIKLFKLLVKQIKLNQNIKDQKLIHVCIE